LPSASIPIWGLQSRKPSYPLVLLKALDLGSPNVGILAFLLRKAEDIKI
jgi:hypothetical protein